VGWIPCIRHRTGLLAVTRRTLAGGRASGVGIVAGRTASTVSGTTRHDGTQLSFVAGSARLRVFGIRVGVMAGGATRVTWSGSFLMALAARTLLRLRSVPGMAVGAVLMLLGVPGQ